MLNQLENLSQDWQLLFKRSKCKVIHIWKQNNQEKDLGVLIDDSLKLSAQCATGAAEVHQLGVRFVGNRERGDMIESYKMDVNPDIWFTPLNDREGATSTTRATSGHLNLRRMPSQNQCVV